MKNIFILTFLLFTNSAFACSDILNSTLRVLDSDDEKNLCEYSGNVVLVVMLLADAATRLSTALQKLF